MATTTCPKCLYQVDQPANICPQCGQQLAIDKATKSVPIVAFCTECGASISAGHKFCYLCGHPVFVENALPQNPIQTQPSHTYSITARQPHNKHKVVAIVLTAAMISIIILGSLVWFLVSNSISSE